MSGSEETDPFALARPLPDEECHERRRGVAEGDRHQQAHEQRKHRLHLQRLRQNMVRRQHIGGIGEKRDKLTPGKETPHGINSEINMKA